MAALLAVVDALRGAVAAHGDVLRARLARTKAEVAKNTAFADAKELLADSLEGIHTITNLVANLKGFARVDRDGLDTIDLNDSIHSALTVVAHQLRDRVKVELKLAPLPKIRCMPSQINQVFLNLLTNAAQAIDGPGTVTIETRERDGEVQASFTDTGSGIPDDVLPRVFDPFFTTKPVGVGTGLGLTTSLAVVAQQHHGELTLGPADGVTRARVVLPRGDDAPATSRRPPSAPAAGR
jgi:two-component system NtrC family sensor kinase